MDDDVVARVVARRAAPSPDPDAIVVQELASACIRATIDFPEDYMRVHGRAEALVRDGYALASAVTGVDVVGPGKAFPRLAELTRFANRVARTGPALLAGPLAPIATALLPDDADAAPAFAAALAAGILLFVYARGVDDPAFAGLAPAPVARKPKQPAPGVAPPRPDLLALIFAAPADDEARLVYADWLISHGDPRGELIVIQCALAGARMGERALPFASRQELAERERDLLKRHERAWLAPIRATIRQWRWDRGFPDHVIADAGKLVDGYAAVCEVPLASAQLTGIDAQSAAALGKLPPHPTLHFLELSQNRLDAKKLRALATAFVSRIAWLDVAGNPFGDAGAAVLASPAFAAVRRLCLSSTRITAAGLVALATAPFWPELERLAVVQNPIDDLRPLRTAPKLTWLLHWCDLNELPRPDDAGLPDDDGAQFAM